MKMEERRFKIKEMSTIFRYVFIFLTICGYCEARKHTLKLKEDARQLVDVSTFGFLKLGKLSVNVSAEVDKAETKLIGFTLDKSASDGSASYLEDHTYTKCILENKTWIAENDSVSVVFFSFNFTDLTLNITRRGRSLRNLVILPMSDDHPECIRTLEEGLARKKEAKRDVGEDQNKPVEKTTGDDSSQVTSHPPTAELTKFIGCPLLNQIQLHRQDKLYYTNFTVYIILDSEEGLYNLFFHNCNKSSPLNLVVNIIESNRGPNYLSAGDIPLPTLFIFMSFLSFLAACYWFIYLRQHKEDVFKIHYLMFLLVVFKALSLMFHAMDYYFIAIDGSPMEAFAILFYITYLTKGALLFLNIALIGSGWAFVKPILSEKDKKLFIVVIPLQVFANVAYIITDTSEEGEYEYSTWKAVFVLVDILCCGAILYPVIWSIRHLQDAATTDGKAAISLSKLQLFRQFYVMVVCYIYFTRIIVYLLKVTVPFRFMWLDKFFFELATFMFFVVTAYKFRPGSDNPYLKVPTEDDDDDLEFEVLTDIGVTEGLTKLSGVNNSTTAVQREGNHIVST